MAETVDQRGAAPSPPETLGARPQFSLARQRWRHVGWSAVIGCALSPLIAFAGEFRAPVPVLLACIVLAAVAGLWRPTRLLLQGGASALAVLTALCLLTPVLRGTLQSLTLAQPPQKADAIVVLGGGVQCRAGTLESSSLTRLIAGLKLWRAGYAPVMTLSQQSGLLWEQTCPKMSRLEADYVRALYPVGGPQLLELRDVMTTRDEAARVRDLARQRGWKTVLVVTTPSHSRRAANLFASYGLRAISVPCDETRFDTALPKPSDRLYALKIIAYEGLSRLKARLGGTPEH